ncbi:hypothetical protein [uncultured Dokdonia sp.]|uniref:hypothetical protein n=1 Tax=uncultured Dokdonia sp. TaxID=575653 RepID=UPI0026155826|nr:hypothetical protein [uncultured Dokdonia sp.]
MEPLFKFCRKEHNLALGATTIRIANMSYYRNFEEKDIGDSQEGIKMSKEFIWNQIHPTNITRFGNSNLIFCASNSMIGSLAEYDSCYKITDYIKFGRILANELIDTIYLDEIRHLDTFLPISTLSEISKVGVEIERRSVRYLKKDEIKNENYNMLAIPFWKDISYKHQDEYRYLFKLFYNDFPVGLSAVDTPFIDLDLKKYRNVLPIELIEL